MSALAAPAERPQAERRQAPASRHPVSRETASQWRLAHPVGVLAVAGLLCFAIFQAGGGLNLQSMTVVEMALTLCAGLVVSAALLVAPRHARVHGTWPLALLVALSALTALSVAWSVAPDSSWQDAGRMLAYSGVFAAAVLVARVTPGGWATLLEGIVLASVVACVYALASKVFPDHVGTATIYARLQEPYGYWNAIGLTATLGAIGCLWLGSRRAGHALATATAYPAMGLMLVTLMLAYSRGALAALAVGVALWMWVVPLRLRGARVLIVSGMGAAGVVAWAFTQHALSSDKVAVSLRAPAGHRLGALLVAMILLLGVAGVAIGFFGDRRAPSAAGRRQVGALLVALLIGVLLAAGGALALSKRGFTGTISHAVSSLTDPNAPVPPNTPGRLTAIGSVRARYWNEALIIFKAHPALGVGASGYETARLRYRKESLDVKHAHGFIVQTLADLGVVGLLVALGLLASWLVCAARATGPWDRRLLVERARVSLGGRALALPRALRLEKMGAPYTPERVGLLSMVCVVVAFGVHSFADWTWYVPGTACVALLCAGWLAGRGPLGRSGPSQLGQMGVSAPGHTGVSAPSHTATSNLGHTGASAQDTLVLTPAPHRRLRTDPAALAAAAGVLALVLVAAWTQWQPQRSVEDSETALAQLARNPTGAMRAARSAVDTDPLSTQALFTLSAVQHAEGQGAAARATLQQAVRQQPSNPQAWLALGQYDRGTNPRAALNELRAAVYLDPQSVPIQNAYVEALRAAPQNFPRTPRASRTARAPGRPPALRTATASKLKSSSRAARVRRV